MSRYIMREVSGRYMIAYGFDAGVPGMGYFFQVYDTQAGGDQDEGLIVNEGFFDGLRWDDMFTLMAGIRVFYGVQYTEKFIEHLKLIMDK